MTEKLTDYDWEEDFSHENGQYRNFCCQCKHEFIGHKRRVVCKKCSMRTEKLTMEIAMKYPKAKVIYKDMVWEIRFIDLMTEEITLFRHTQYDVLVEQDYKTFIENVNISDCKLQLRPLSSLTEEEKKYIIAQWLNETLDKWTNLDEVFVLIFDTCSFEDIIRFIDYLRSINIDIDGLQERGIAMYE